MTKQPSPPKMPETIRVCGLDYTIKVWDRLAADNAGAYGLCDKGNLTILVQEGLKSQQEARVLLHEVIHACFMSGGLREISDSHKQEEQVVDILAYQLVTVIRDNPGFVAYMQEAFR